MTMMIWALMALAGGAGTEPHHVQIEHNGHRVDVVYRSDVQVAHKQVGSISAPGRPSTLRCQWRATMDVHREARLAAGHVMSRRIGTDTSVTGSRPGACEGQRKAIAAEVAAAGGKLREHLLAIVAADRGTLVAELEAAPGMVRS